MNLLVHAITSMVFFRFGCFGLGFMKEPSVDEIVNGVYQNISMLPPERSLKMHGHVERITNELRKSDGRIKLRNLIIYSMEDMRRHGLIDWEELWTKYMVPKYTPRRRPIQNEDRETANQLEQNLRKWCLNVRASITVRKGYDEPGSIDELFGKLTVTGDTVEVAINLHTLALVVKSYYLMWSMVSHFSVFQTAKSLPASYSISNEHTLRRFQRDEQDIINVGAAFHEAISLKRNRIKTEEEFNHIIGNIAPKPYQMEMNSFPVSPWVPTCKREYKLMNGLIEVCMETGSTMAAKDPMFWEQLEIVAEKENFTPFLVAYKDLCKFFEKGLPYDRLFEFYWLSSRIVHDIKMFGHDETKKVIQARIKFKSLQEGDTLSVEDAELVKQFETMDYREIAIRVPGDKMNLAMNYVEEFHRQSNLPTISKMYTITNLRAHQSQLMHISLLLCDLMSVDYIITRHHVAYQICREIFHTNLPMVIKQTASQFVRFLVDSLQVVHMLKNLPQTPIQPRYTFPEWDTELWEALHQVRLTLPDPTYRDITEKLRVARSELEISQESLSKDQLEIRIKEYNTSVKKALGLFHLEHCQPEKMIPLQDIPVIWKAMQRATDREFSNIHPRNAEILLKCLSRIQTVVRNSPAIDRIYYAMSHATPSEQILLVKQVGDNLLESKMAGKIASNEANTLMKLSKSIGESTNTLDYLAWKEKVFPRSVYSLPTHLVMTLRDAFADCSRNLAMAKPKGNNAMQEIVSLPKELHFYQQIKQEFLSTESKEYLEHVMGDLAEKYLQPAQAAFIEVHLNHSDDYISI